MEEVRLLNALLDVNVMLDVFLEREPWVAEAEELWTAHHRRRYVGHIAAHGFTNLFYVARKIIGLEKAREAVRLCLQTFVVIPVGRPELELADSQPGSDMEDNLVVACASVLGLDAIVTRDPSGFRHSPIRVLSPAEFLDLLPQDQPEGPDHDQGEAPAGPPSKSLEDREPPPDPSTKDTETGGIVR
jgi:predicted nucleic acid-binding protein